jgi:hypothetical protein
VEREGRGEGWEGNTIEGKGREWKGRGGRKRGGEGMDAPGAGPPQNFWARTATGFQQSCDRLFYQCLIIIFGQMVYLKCSISRCKAGPPGIPVLKVENSPPLSTKFPKIPVFRKRPKYYVFSRVNRPTSLHDACVDLNTRHITRIEDST